MRITFLFVLFLGLSFVSNAQRGYTVSDKKAVKAYEEALQAYDQRNFDLALLHLQSAQDRVEGFIESYILEGQIQSMLGRKEQAIQSLEKAQSIDPTFYPTNNYFLGELYLTSGKYTESAQAFSSYMAVTTVTSTNSATFERAALGVSCCEFALNALANPVPFDPINLGPAVNSENGEYYPCLTVDESQLLFTRELPNPRAPEGMDEDFYFSGKGEDQAWLTAAGIPEVNSNMREGAPSLSPDGRFLFFTACGMFGEYGPNREGFGSCDLFVSMHADGRWTLAENLGPAINSRSWESQPSFSADGRTLYFVRGYYDAQGVNKRDIWQAELNEDGSWGKAVRVPGEINTEYEEESVLIHPDGKTLYFASNGHPGMGGLDIFVSRKQADGTWGTPVNLGYPINTHNDENSLLVSAKGQVAMFASDRKGGFGDLDLYEFDLPEHARANPVTFTRGVVMDSRSFKRLGANFELIDLETGDVVVESASDERSGEFLLPLPAGREYALNVNRLGYLFHSEHFVPEATASGEPFELEILLSKLSGMPTVTLNNIFFASNEHALLPASTSELERLVDFLETNPTLHVSIDGHTDNVGSVDDNQGLSERRAQAVVNYLVKAGIAAPRLQAIGHGEAKPIESNDTEQGRARNRRTEFVITKV